MLGNLPYCHDDVLDSIQLMTLTCEAAKKEGTGPFARTLLKAGTWLVKLAITTAASMAAEDTLRNWGDEDVAVHGAKKRGGKKKAGKKKAGKKSG
jgi:hypothetical protein